MRFKTKQKGPKDWKEVFKFLPVTTVDGYTVSLGFVWKRETGDVMNPVEYCTNPYTYEIEQLTQSIDNMLDERYEDERNAIKEEIRKINNMAWEAAGGEPVADFQLENIGMTDEIRAWSKGKPLTEGKMRHGSNPMPPVKRPKRPPPPPAPPPKKYVTDSSGNHNIAIGHAANRVVIEEKGKEAKVCPDCGTIDCYKGPAKFNISGAGVVSVDSRDIFASCKGRQQMRALEKLNIGKKKTGSVGPR